MRNYKRFVEEFQAESDRGAAILPLCVLEQMLREGLAARLLIADKETMRRLAPRGSLTVLARNCRVVGLITASELKCIEDLGEIRGKFAHAALLKLSFDTASVAQLIDKLEPAVELIGLERSKNTRRNWYLIVVSTLHGMIFIRQSNIRRIEEPHLPAGA